MASRSAHSRTHGPTPTSAAPPSRLARERQRFLPFIVSDVLRGPGRSLDSRTREFMEPRFGRDFSHVRVHDDPAAGQSARAIGARAYSTGDRIVVDSSRHASGSGDERRLLAHELTHVAQQPGGASGTQGFAIDEHPAREAEANRTTDIVSRGESPVSVAHAAVPAGGVQRQTEEAAADGGTAAGTGAAGASGVGSASCIESVVGEEPATLAEAGTVTIVQFTMLGCGPCHMNEANFEQMCAGFRDKPPKAPVRVFAIDIAVEGNEELGKRYAPGGTPEIYIYVGGSLKARYSATVLEPNVLDALVAEYAEEASQSGAWKGFKKGAFWGGLGGLGLGIAGAIAVGTQANLEGNAMMAAVMGTVVGGVAVGAGIAGGIGAIAGKLTEEKKGSRRKKKKKQPKQRSGTVHEPDEIEADAMAALALRTPPGRPSRSAAAVDTGAGGAPIESTIRSDMESRFRRDFGHVRLHRNAAAHCVADDLQAYAVTEGSDIYFAHDGYAPGTMAGRAILAHELAHVAQQDTAAPSAATPSLESEAAHAATRVVQGRPIGIQHSIGDDTPPLAITRGKKSALGGLIGAVGGAAVGAGIGLIAAAFMKDKPYGLAAGIGAAIGGGVGLIAGLITGYVSRRTSRVGAQEADMLIRRQYGQYMPGGVPAPLRNALIRPVSHDELLQRIRCRHEGEPDPTTIGWTDTGTPWRAAQPPDPDTTITRPEDEVPCLGGQLEHATPERPVIYFQHDTPDAGILIHEGLHAIASPEFQRVHDFVNEGTTELYTRRLLDDVNIAKYGTGYDTRVREVEKFERLVGKEPLARAYFSGDIAGLDRAAAAIFGPCSLQEWAFALQMNGGESRDAEAVLAGRHVDYCATGSESLGAEPPPPAEGVDEAHRAGGAGGGQ